MSTHLTLKIICSCNTAKSLSDFKHFPADMVSLGVRESVCTAPFIDAQELQMSVYYCIYPKKIFFRKTYLMGVGFEED